MSGEGPHPSHLGPDGSARMVDVGAKPPVARRAVASATVTMSPAAARAVADGEVPKGDVAAVARVSGIMAAKRTPELVALCHPLPIERVGVDVVVEPGVGTVRVVAEVATTARTGVEMEALTAASVAALNVYDMVKGIDPGAAIERVALVEKTKGAAAGGPA